jgi:hypothetical protein
MLLGISVSAQGEITIIDERNKELLGVYMSNKGSGKYLLVFHPLVNYKMIGASSDKEVITKDVFFEFPEENNAEINL